MSSSNHLIIEDELSKIFSTPHQQKQKIQNTTIDHNNGKLNENKRKMMHRDVERLRRQEMAIRYASLRSLLPAELIKGKRSVSDHMNEAAKYIKHLEQNIERLRNMRDKLSKSFGYSISASTDVVKVSACKFDYVAVQPSWFGVEVVVSCRMRDGAVSLSKVLQVLAEEGFGAISCASIRANENLLHTIQAKVLNPAVSINVSGTEKKLLNLVGSSLVDRITFQHC